MSAEAEAEVAALERAVSHLEKVRLRAIVDFLNPATGRRHQAFYVTTNGVVRLDQDAPFVAEGFVVQALVNSASIRVSVEDRAAGRGFTTARAPAASGVLPLVSVDGAAIDIGALVPVGVPISGTSGDISGYCGNWDDWFRFPTALVLPRGGVVQFQFAAGTTTPVVTLVGYKVLAE